jgi:DnaJ-class molecular chaperone
MTKTEFLKEVNKIMSHPGKYTECPDCYGLGGHTYSCECLGYGCRKCRGKGEILIPCRTCEGKGEVFIYETRREETP